MLHSLLKEDGLHFEKAAEEELQGVIGATTTKKLSYLVLVPNELKQACNRSAAHKLIR